MVRRLLAGGALVVALGLGAAPAQALNTRVSIASYAWSQPSVRIDLGERVIWDWLGPDLEHSVTGVSANAAGLDSDPRRELPRHRAGDSFTLSFERPGTYLFQCKLHAVVRGEVVVSAAPGDPASDPGPRPPLSVDLRRPTLGAVALSRKRTAAGRGIPFSARISERGSLDATYYRFNSAGRRVYTGYTIWPAFIGINRRALGARGERFAARPGRYLAVLRATDAASNVSRPVRKTFSIVSRRRP